MTSLLEEMIQKGHINKQQAKEIAEKSKKVLNKQLKK